MLIHHYVNTPLMHSDCDLWNFDQKQRSLTRDPSLKVMKSIQENSCFHGQMVPNSLEL